jgi:hypothetical protein
MSAKGVQYCSIATDEMHSNDSPAHFLEKKKESEEKIHYSIRDERNISGSLSSSWRIGSVARHQNDPGK